MNVEEAIPDRISRPIVAEMLQPFPREFRAGLIGRWRMQWARTEGPEGDKRRAANSDLRALRDAAAGAVLPINADDDTIAARAERRARQCRTMTIHRCVELGEADGIDQPFAPWTRLDTDTGEIDEGRTVAALHERYKSAAWWRAQLRRVHAREVERIGRLAGLVSVGRQIYVTDTGVRQRRQMERRNRDMLAAWEAVNELGESFTLAELADLGVSNPAIRRNELMCRISGTETWAKLNGHKAVFLTVTCPSRYHAVAARSRKLNPRHDGSTPRDGQAYLNTVWQRTRAALDRKSVGYYGMRVAEPHHDGTPHWHLLIWTDSPREVVTICRRYAMQDSPKEPGAGRFRFKVEYINPAKGSATAYVAKYISKAIDGHGITADLYGVDAASSAERVRAWAGRWGIRQFQFFGCAPVGVWRELRRMGEGCAAFAKHATAADEGDWCDYLRAMERDPLAPLKEWRDEPGRYGEPKGWQIIGVQDAAETRAAPTRMHTWEIRRKGGEFSSAHEAAGRAAAIRGIGRPDVGKGQAGCKGFGPAARAGGIPGAQRAVALSASGEAVAPWSPVNNCTELERWKTRNEPRPTSWRTSGRSPANNRPPWRH